MSLDPIDRVIDEPAPKQIQRDEPGWTAWVDQAALRMPRSPHERRPWCRGVGRAGVSQHWFPRTSKRPREGGRYAVFSPAHHLPKLDRPGWFLAACFLTRPPAWVPPDADPCGVLPEAFVRGIHDRLSNFYRDRYVR